MEMMETETVQLLPADSEVAFVSDLGLTVSSPLLLLPRAP